MLTLNDIINVSFQKMKFSGYNTDQVDDFIDEVQTSYEALIKKTIEQKEQNEKLTQENAQLLKKLEVLADKVEEYRQEEDQIKNALVSAQKLGDASIREARHKAEIILKDANLKAEHVVDSAKSQIVEEQQALELLKKQVSDFREKLLDLYKEHLTLINAIPSHKEPAKAAAQPETASEPEPQPEPEEKEEPQKEEPAPVQEEPTKEFSVDAVGFEAGSSAAAPVRDMRYDVLKFGDSYDISKDH